MAKKRLDNNLNYIVSGLERSGTSMLMQILHSGKIPVSFDESRPADSHNPRGYFELEGGKIINKIMNGTFPFERCRGSFIKITSYGLKYLPVGRYKIIYSERDIEEVLDSMEKMIGGRDDKRDETRKSLLRLNNMIKREIHKREDIGVLTLSYNRIIKNPRNNMTKILDFLGLTYDGVDVQKMIDAVDINLCDHC
jgi:hypothetical protein